MDNMINTEEFYVGNIYNEFEIPISGNDTLHSVEILPQLYLFKKKDTGDFAVYKDGREKKVKSLNEYHGCLASKCEMYPLCSYHTQDSNSDYFIYDEDGKMYEDEKLKDVIFRQKRKHGKISGLGYYSSLKDFLKREYDMDDDVISLERAQLLILKFNMRRPGCAILLDESVKDSINLLNENNIYFENSQTNGHFIENDSLIISTIKNS